MSTPDDVVRALHAKAGFELIKGTTPDKQLHLTGRVLVDALGRNVGSWVILIQRLSVAMESQPWKVDFSKKYFLRPGTDKVVFAWRVIFQAAALDQCYDSIVKAIQSSPASSVTDIMEMPLGPGSARNDPGGGRRGASAFGKAVVGAAAARQKAAGG